MILSHKIRVYPNQEGRRYFSQAVGTARFAYNWALHGWQEKYKAGERPSAYSLDKEFNSIKKKEFPWTGQVSKWVTQKAIQNLGDAFKRFFKKTSRYPKFKKKGRCRESFYINGNHLKVRGKRIKVPNLGWVKMAQEVRFPGKVKSATFSFQDNRWFTSIQVEVEDSWVYPHRCESQASVGIDLGIFYLAVLSTGEKIENQRTLRKWLVKLKEANRNLSRKKKGSSNRIKARKLLARVHAKIRNIRLGILHKTTTRLVEFFKYIGMEDLNVRGMLKNGNLAKDIQDVSWGEFRRQMEYKSLLSGSEVSFVDRFYPSSKLCSFCGWKMETLPLNIRVWTCPLCGTSHDRDINAARNLDPRGHWGCGEDVRPGFPRQSSLKQKSVAC